MQPNSKKLIANTRRHDLPALLLVQTPRLARMPAKMLFFIFVALPFVLLFVPWTQTVHGTGRAIAFNPVQRPQFIVSPIEGRIKKWFIVEGDRVTIGQRIVELVDNDPNLELRLLDEEKATLDRLRAAESRIQEIQSRIRNLDNSRLLAISVQSSILQQELARLQTFEQELLEAQVAFETAKPNYDRVKALYQNKRGGLASERDLELATQAVETARLKTKQSEARVRLGQATKKAAEDNLKKVDSDTAAMINLETASLRSAEGDVGTIRRDKAQIEVRIARQRAQYIDAPCNGTVYRLLANAEDGGILVRPGERLTMIVPDITETQSNSNSDPKEVTDQSKLTQTDSDSDPDPKEVTDQSKLTRTEYPGIVAEMLIDGNDLPLIQKGDRVRLQFEGWPAVQFIGWPSVAVGTFGGRVYLVDPTTNDKGQFRVLVEPDKNEVAWPNERYLRQGVRAQGWVLLNRVSVGWELWRNVNGFPPARETQESKPSQPLGPVKLKERK